MCVCVCVCNHEHNVPLSYHHNGFVATHALMMYGCILLVSMNQGVLNKLCKEHNISI